MGMRWAALGVDYEMYGKDHLTQAPLYDAICRIAGGTPPEQFMFELFLDDKGQKISKSKGNGITIEEWLAYGPAGKAFRCSCSRSRAPPSAFTSM